ncbi:MAG: molybdopterin converting factor subunit 1 [Chloroflexi bacterium]|nr:molybdopterin converting factor subunit 1 [Chloroflexota bacterium]
MITIQIRLFAAHRDIVGRPELTLAQPAGATLGEVWAHLVVEHPALARYTGRLLFAVNQQFADPTTVLHDGDEVAFIPPVSGGAAVL